MWKIPSKLRFLSHFGGFTVNFNAMTLFICFPKPKNRKFHVVCLRRRLYLEQTVKGPFYQWQWSIWFQEEGYLQFVLWLLHPDFNFEILKWDSPGFTIANQMSQFLIQFWISECDSSRFIIAYWMRQVHIQCWILTWDSLQFTTNNHMRQVPIQLSTVLEVRTIGPNLIDSKTWKLWR